MLRHVSLLLVMGTALSAQAQKVTLRYNPPVGKSYVFQSVMTSKQDNPQGSTTMKQSMTITTKIVKNAGGKVTTLTTASGAKVTATGPAAQMVPNMEKSINSMKTTSVVDNRGRPVDMKAAGPEAMQQMMSGMSSGLGAMQAFPVEAVGAGSKWVNTVDFQKMMAGMLQGMTMTGGKMPMTMVLKSFENRNGRRLAVIQISMKGTFSIAPPKSTGPGMGSVTTTMKTDGVIRIDVATGMTIEAQSTGSGTTMINKMKMVQTYNSSMKLK